MWDKMQEIFGNAWSNQYTNSPNSTWIDALAQLSETDINRGLNALLKSRAKYAPNLAVFLGMCELVDDRTPEQRQQAAIARESELLLRLPKASANSSPVKRGKCWELALELEKQGKIGNASEAEKLWSIH